MEGKLRLKQIEKLIYGDGDTRLRMSQENLANPQLNQRIYHPGDLDLSSSGIPTKPEGLGFVGTLPANTLSVEDRNLLESSVTNLSKQTSSSNPFMSGMSSSTLTVLKSSKKKGQLSGSNLISEDQLHKTYLEFCSQMGGVRAAGLRAFKKRMEDLRYEMGYQLQVMRTEMGVEKHFYIGIKLITLGAA
jgi:hypothetical protein